jgi:hypothetical protein
MKSQSSGKRWWLKVLLSLLLVLGSFGLFAGNPSPAFAKAKYSDQTEQSVYITKTGKKYHRAGCRYLKWSRVEVSKAKAIELGKEPCKICRP